VLLDVPNLSVEEITLEVEKFARQSLARRAARQPLAVNRGRGREHRQGEADDQGRTLDSAGGLANQRMVGSVLDLTRVGSDTNNTAGQTIRRVRDTGGAVIELTLDTAGRVLNSRVVSGATGNQRQ